MLEISRRDLLCTLCAAAVACKATDGGPIDTLPDDTDPDTDTDTPVDTDTNPNTICIDPGTAAQGWTELPLSQYPELADLYGFVYLTLAGKQIVIAQVEEGCYAALERPCTHEGVAIEYRPERNGFVCPRHGAIYAWDGRVLAGPPPMDLQSFPCGPRDGSVWILVD
ncbi:MAG: Rieske (2Fe-2S) protein [Alphaproteobacteria bacterium]|nr:Rieske (2Fe-2S) protein [Alphaproteobacteria bacterium]